MKRRRVVVAGVVRWEDVPEPGDVEFALIGVLRRLTTSRSPARPVDLHREPGIERCPLCGAWGPPGACRTPHPDGGRQLLNRQQRNAPSRKASRTTTRGRATK